MATPENASYKEKQRAAKASKRMGRWVYKQHGVTDGIPARRSMEDGKVVYKEAHISVRPGK